MGKKLYRSAAYLRYAVAYSERFRLNSGSVGLYISIVANKPCPIRSVANCFDTRLAELKPEAKEVLKVVHIEDPTSGEFQAHAFRVLNSIDVFINLLTDAEALDAALAHHSEEHAKIPNIKKEHFKVGLFPVRFSISRLLIICK